MHLDPEVGNQGTLQQLGAVSSNPKPCLLTIEQKSSTGRSLFYEEYKLAGHVGQVKKDIDLRAIVADKIYTFVYQVIPKVIWATASPEKYQLTFPQSRYASFRLGQ
jgi:hypothetical protein